MKQKIVSKSEFKPKVLEYLRLVEQTQQPLVISHHRKPVIKVVPYQKKQGDPFKDLRGSVLEYKDPYQPVGLNDWEALT